MNYNVVLIAAVEQSDSIVHMCSSSDGKASACNAGYPGSIPGSGISLGEGNCSSILAWRNHGQRSLAGYSPRGRKESDMTEQLTHTYILFHAHFHSGLSKDIEYNSPWYTGRPFFFKKKKKFYVYQFASANPKLPIQPSPTPMLFILIAINHSFT